MIMFWILGIIGAIIDSIFITIFYHVKYPIKRYKLLIAILTALILISFLFDYSYIKLILMMILTIISMLFAREGYARTKWTILFYFIIPNLLIGTLQAILLFAVPIGTIFYLLIWISEIAIIGMLYEDKDYKFEFRFLGISLKILLLLCFLLFICLSKYYFTMR